MADNLTPFDPTAPQAPAAKPGIRGFLNSRAGKLIVGGAAVVLIVGILGIIGLGFFGATDDGSDVAVTTTAPSGGGTSTQAPTEAVDIKVPEDVEFDDVFTYRDVFVPTVVLTTNPTTTDGTTANSSTGGTTSSTTNTAAQSSADNTLVLQDIATEDGEPVAVLAWNGETYTLAEGESIPDTPWQVLEIRESTVVMLYGDQSITLSVGVGISK